jgi:hypothetical protein
MTEVTEKETADKLQTLGEQIIQLAMDNLTPRESCMLLGAIAGCMARASGEPEQFMMALIGAAKGVIDGEALNADE